MQRGKSINSKQTNSNYQSLYLWARFLLGMISLGIVLWRYREIFFSSVMPADSKHPVYRDMEALHLYSLDPYIPVEITLDSSFRFASSLTLSALTYHQTQNSFVSLLTLTWPTLISATRFDKRQVVGKEFRVNTHIPKKQVEPVIKKLSNGELIIAWKSEEQDGSSWGVYAQRFTNDGTALDSEFQVNNITQNEQDRASIEALSTGDFVIVWHSNLEDSSSYSIYGRIYNSNGVAISNEILINMFTAGEQSNPVVFANTPDEFLVLWQSIGQDGSDKGVYGRYYFNNETVNSNEFRLNDYTNGTQDWMAGAVISYDRWIVAWDSIGQDGSHSGIYAKIFNKSAATVGAEIRLNQFTQNGQGGPTFIHFLDEFVVIFLSENLEVKDNYSVYGRRFADNGTALSDEFQVGFRTSGPPHKPSAAMLSDSYFVVVWYVYTSMLGIFNIYGRICHRKDHCISQDFRINSKSVSADFAGEQVAALNNESFIVTYHIVGGDPDGSDGVYARIINLKDLNITLPAITTTTTESWNTQTPTQNNSPAVTIGIAAAACVVGTLIGAAGFFAVNKCRKSKPSLESNNNEVALQNRNAVAQTSSRNYGEIDATKKDSQQYDRPVELKI